MSDDEALSHASLVTKLSHASNGGSVENGDALQTLVEVKCSWSPAVDPPKTHRHQYALVFVDVKINVKSGAGDDCIEYEKSEGLEELLNTVKSSTPLIPGGSWFGSVLVVVPTHSGYLARTKCFQERFIGCTDLGILLDRTVFGQRLNSTHSQKLQALLNGSVFMLVRPGNHSHLCDNATVIEEVQARINYQWLLDHEPKQKTLAVVDGHLNPESYLPFFNSATALGIKFVIFDRPGHWISDPSMRHLYQDFVPIDMTPDDGFHLRIATAVKAYGHVDGLCAIASYCLVPVARAAPMLGLVTVSPDAVACAVNKHETRLVDGDVAPTALVTDVSDLKDRMAAKEFIPTYPLIVKPIAGTGSAHVYKADSEAELLEGVRRTSEDSGKKVLIEAYIDGPEFDVNFVLLDGEIIFFEIADDFPSPGDNGTIDSDFWENTNVLPSKLPADEYAVVRQKLHRLLLKIGLKTGVFHLEARVQDCSMAYSEKDGLLDLRSRSNASTDQLPRCALIEVNPRPPGMPCILATIATYGVNMYALHLLSSLGDHERLRALARPFEPHPDFPNHGRAWSQLVWLRADKGGICASDDVCGEFLQRLPADDRAFVTTSVCFFHRGQLIPEPKPGLVLFGAFFIVTSRRDRHDVLRVSRVLQHEFCIPVTPV